MQALRNYSAVMNAVGNKRLIVLNPMPSDAQASSSLTARNIKHLGFRQCINEDDNWRESLLRYDLKYPTYI